MHHHGGGGGGGGGGVTYSFTPSLELYNEKKSGVVKPPQKREV